MGDVNLNNFNYDFMFNDTLTYINTSFNYLNNYVSFTDFTVNSILHGVDWVYSYVESLTLYDFKIVYFLMYNSVYDASYDFFFISLWYFTFILHSSQLFWSYLLDSYIVNDLIVNNYDHYWYKTMLASKDLSLISIHHPEFLLIAKQCSTWYISNFTASLNLSIQELVETERLITPISTIIDLMFFFLIISFFISIYFSYFSSHVREEVTVDYDYMIVSGTVEAEKEITGIDDVIMGVVLVLYFIGWYFYVHCWCLISEVPELILLFYLLPGLFFLIILMPMNLIYDFGGLFLAYLRGVGATPLILYELMFDYIAVLIFCVRILVQGVRIILMVFTYASMHDLIMLAYCADYTFAINETFWEELSAISFSIKSVSWYLLVTLPARIMYWLYEVLHTFFVLTGQCVAFFAIVFWLYLFLYTFFVFEKQEDYFYYKRLELRKYYKGR